MNFLCRLHIHRWRDAGPPKAAVDAAFAQGGVAILSLIFLRGIYMHCERCGLENSELKNSGGMAARQS